LTRQTAYLTVLVLSMFFSSCLSKKCPCKNPGVEPLLHSDVRHTLEMAGLDPAKINCISKVFWRAELDLYANQASKLVEPIWSESGDLLKRKKTERVILGYLVRSLFELKPSNNLGVTRLKGRFYTQDGQLYPLLLFRSSVSTDAAEPGSCFKSLLGAGQVKHVINLYSSSFPLYDFIEQERSVAAELGASCWDVSKTERPWRELIEKPEDYPKNFQAAQASVAELISSQILNPAGAEPRGNILVHCGGGMHRSGMVFGILQRCINNDPPELIEEVYKRHVGFISAQEPGGYEELNLRFIAEFDCNLLKPRVAVPND
jgi:hypothetical protein